MEGQENQENAKKLLEVSLHTSSSSSSEDARSRKEVEHPSSPRDEDLLSFNSDNFRS